ncbi:DUF4189 domain-containing protein [Nocardia sp. NPDC059180]|uniref:DUF4189 domain-containing protein n=1 Tax=Nocardia sp. NPDC059180 TaxID=3346761 RepID=UPI0036822416
MSIKRLAGSIGAGMVAAASVAALTAAPANAAPGVDPPKFVAIAYSPATGAFGWHNEVYSYDEAVNGAFAHCFNSGGTDCTLAAIIEGGCASLLINAERPSVWGAGARMSRDEAFGAALNDYRTRAGSLLGNGNYRTVIECAFNPHW